jgi:hypothetical protein
MIACNQSERRLLLNRSKFLGIHEICVTAMRSYVVEAEKTISMLVDCAPEPLSFNRRFKLMCQQIAENDAHLTYLGDRGLLLRAARLGYENVN